MGAFGKEIFWLDSSNSACIFIKPSKQGINMTAIEARYFGPLLLDIGIALLHSGASSKRVRITMLRFAAAYQFDLHLDMGPKSISLSLTTIS